MKFNELDINDTFIFPFQSSEAAYKKINGKISIPTLSQNSGYKKDTSPEASVMKVEIDNLGKPILPPPYNHVPFELWGKGTVELPPNWSYYGKRIIWEKSKITILSINRTVSTNKYTVILDDGEWPSDRAIMMICDGNIPTVEGHPGHFGGSVTKDGNRARVVVFVD